MNVMTVVATTSPSPHADEGPGNDLSLAEHLENWRRESFIGRIGELAVFDEMRQRNVPGVLLLHGDGGIGKTALMNECARRARQEGHHTVEFRRTPAQDAEEFLREVISAVSTTAGSFASRHDASERSGRRAPIVFIDGIDGLELQFREQLLPELPASTMAVLSLRSAPQLEWVTDPGWRLAARTVLVSALQAPESARLLDHLGVAPGFHAALQNQSQGHPLALILLGNQHVENATPTTLADAPESVALLFERLVGTNLSQVQSDALFIAAHMTTICQHVLHRLLPHSDVDGIWDWLHSLSFVRRHVDGLQIGGLARNVIELHQAHEGLPRHERLRRQIRQDGFALFRVGGTENSGGARHLVRPHHAGRLYSSLNPLLTADVTVRRGGPGDRSAAITLIHDLLGEAEARRAEQWLGTQPHDLWIASAGGTTAVSISVDIDDRTDRDIDDPIAHRFANHPHHAGTFAPNETPHLLRFVAGERDDVSVAACLTALLDGWMTSDPACGLALVPATQTFADLLSMLAMTPLHLACHDLAGRSGYAIDFRRLAVDAWIDLMITRESSGGEGPPPAHLLRPAPLTKRQFDSAVASALREFHRDERLFVNPLHDRLRTADHPGTLVEALRERITAAVSELRRAPRTRILAHILDLTYLMPEYGQRDVAKHLNIPFTTYRRYLAQAETRVADLLWFDPSRLRPQQPAMAPDSAMKLVGRA